MKFIKTLEKRRGERYEGNGSIIIANNRLAIRISDNKVDVKDVGIIEGGIGIVVEKSNKKRNSPCIFSSRHFESTDIPVELQGEKYRFRIPGEKISDTEYVFMFKKAKMLNKK